MEDDINYALMVHAKTFIAADFLDIPKLQEVAASKFKNERSTVNSEASQFLQVIRLVYSETRRANELRKVIVDQVTACDMEGLEELMEEIHDFSKDIAIRLTMGCRAFRKRVSEFEEQEQRSAKRTKNWEGIVKVQCRSCRHTWGSRLTNSSSYCPSCGVWVGLFTVSED